MSSPASSPSPSPDAAGPATPATAELAVEGMHCGSCVALIEESLTEQAGVREASVDLDSGRAVVRYDPEVLGAEDLRTTITEAGYSATLVG